MKRPPRFLRLFLWNAVVVVLVALIGAGVLTNVTLRSVEKNLPNTLLEQLHDVALIIEDLAEVLSTAELTKAVPRPDNFMQLRKKVAEANGSIIKLRHSYVFDNLIQASSIHAVVAPALADVQVWLSEGVSGYGPETDTTIDIVLLRISKAFNSARELNHASVIRAKEILNTQRYRLDQFLFSVNLLFAVALAISFTMVLLLILQHTIEGREIEAQAERRRAEQSLRESENKFKTLFNTAGDGIAIHDLEGRFLEINQVLCDRLGYSREEMLQLTLTGISVPERTILFPDWVDELTQKGTVFLETVCIRRDGLQIPVEVNSRMIDFSGQRAILSILRDITERKHAEQALRESEATLKSIFRVAPIGIGLVADRVLRQVNDRLCEMVGYGREELVGESARILYPTREEFEQVGKVKYAQIREWGTGTVQTLWKKRDGAIIDVLLSSTPLDPADLSAGVTFTAMDITESKRAQEALSESQERFRELAELLPETIFEMDADGALTFVNQNAFDHFGYSQEDFEHGLNAFELVSPEERPKALENANKIINGEAVGLKEYRVVRKDGSTFPAILHSTAKFINGKPVGLRGIIIDITETKTLESQLRQAHKMEAIGTLAGGIAHDFNNLLQAVQGYAELLLLRMTAEESGYRELTEITRAAQRGGELTRQLLTFCRDVDSKLSPIDLNRTVNDVRMLLERTISKMITIELHLTGNVHSINADASQIEQVMMNLAVNARDAMPKGGRLTIETKNVFLDEDYCGSRPDLTPGDYVLLRVSDTGQGMDKKTLEQIFDPFFTTKEVGKGTGLGLAIVYGIVKNHRGYIICASNPGEGSSFDIYFPAVESPGEPIDINEGKTEPPSGDETILLVDDDDTGRALAKTMLQMFGYVVITAPDGESASKIYREAKDKIDLVILDRVMPGMGGALCLQNILEANPQARVIIASGYSAKGEQEQTRLGSARAFITKPYNVQEMLKVVRDALC